MNRNTDKLIEELRVVRTGLNTGIHEVRADANPRTAGARNGSGFTGKTVPLPGWANIIGDAIALIDELSEIRRVRLENDKLKRERTTLRRRNTQLARVNYALSHQETPS